jgi:CHAT domain-containing protein
MTRGGAWRLAEVLVALAAALPLSVAFAPAALAAATCQASLGGNVLAGSTPTRPLEVNVADTPVAAAFLDPRVRTVSITLFFGPAPLPVVSQEPIDPSRGTPAWSKPVSVEEHAQLGVGLYELHLVGADDTGAVVCEDDGWIVVRGKNPWQTPVGLIAIAVLVAGLLQILRAVLSASRGRGGIIGAALGGAVSGLAMLLLAQQAGVAKIALGDIVIWMGLPAAASAVVHSLIGFAGGPTSPQPTGQGAPQSTGQGAPQPTGQGAPQPTGQATGHGTPGPGTPQIPEPIPAQASTGAATTGTAAGGASVAAGHVPGTDRDDRDPPRTSYARVECPDALVGEQQFELLIGLAGRPDDRVAGEPLVRPETSIGPYTITIQVIADGMSLARGDESWRVDLRVTADEPYPFATIHLVPVSQREAVRLSSIRVMYSVDGHPIGLANRTVAIVRTAALLETAPAQPPAPAVELGVPMGDVPPDLTVRIERADSESSGQLLVQLLAADPQINVPPAPMRIDIGADPADDLRRIIREMNAVEGGPAQFVSLRGVGLTISDQLPQAFWDVLRQIAGRLDRPPMILFLSAEPYVPWELAVVEPPLDASAPPFLSAQAIVGRWVLGQRRPRLPPPSSLQVSSVAVVSGIYNLPGWHRLVAAEAEASDLVVRLGATPVNATARDVIDLLRGSPGADLIHFAVHGNYDSEGAQDGLILVDGMALDPLAIRGTPFRGAPFVFLNACQVGRGNQILGDHAGLAAAFLFAGASCVIAPLWSIDDEVAREIALRFYERSMRGDMAADILRQERAAFRDAPDTRSSTYLAYQYFGHPAFRLSRASPQADPNNGMRAPLTTPAASEQR